MMTCLTTTSKRSAKFLKRSCVSGRGGLISFSKAIAMDCASKAPITMGNFRSPSTKKGCLKKGFPILDSPLLGTI